MQPKSIKEIAHHIGSETSNEVKVFGTAVDSRLVGPGDLFFALPGAQTDGHLFLADVASKGALAAVVNSDYQGPNYGLILLKSSDVLRALQNLSKAYLSESKAKVVAVTGSLGKTTTKEFIANLLRSKYKVSASPGNSNSQIGLPLSILNHTKLDDDILIFEMGMTERGQISKLIEIAPPVVSVVTMVALVHACYFDSIEDIAHAKAEVFAHPLTKLGIYPKERDYGCALSQTGSCQKFSFSTIHSDADFYLHASKEMSIKDNLHCSSTMPLLHLPGDHNRHNFLAAVAVARSFGLSFEEIQDSVKTLILPERRLQIIEKFGAIFVNDSYNASELSMKAALNSLPTPKAGRKKIAVFGGMVELGKFSDQCHRAVGEYALNHVDLMLCFGNDCLPIYECWHSVGRPVVWTKDRQGTVEALRTHLEAGDVVLLKGSRLKGVWKVLDEL